MIERLLEIGKRVLTEPDIGRLLERAMDGAIEITGAERGLVILFEEKEKAIFETARNLAKADIENPKFQVSQTVIETVKKTGAPLYSHNIMQDEAFLQSRSAASLKLLSVICLPLIFEKEIFGVVYLDNRSVLGAFEEKAFQFAKSFADFISLAAHHALERKQLQNHIDALEIALRDRYDFANIVGAHPKMVDLLEL
ncbi:MAG: GAF domain-containing protein, partial [bacterium]